MAQVAKVEFTAYEASVFKALDLIAAGSQLPRKGLIIIKPNLTNASPPPVTTPVGAAEAVLKYCRRHSRAEVAIGEGCGDGVTQDTFDANGYTRLARKYGIRLIDFNEERAVTVTLDRAFQLKEFHLPV